MKKMIKESVDFAIEVIKNHDEGYDEIVELIFTDEMKKKKYSDAEKNLILANFKLLKIGFSRFFYTSTSFDMLRVKYNVE